MRILFLLFILFATSEVTAQDKMQMVNSSELAPGTFVVFHSGQGFTITVESDDGLISSVQIPKGVALSIQAIEKNNPEWDMETFPQTYNGDVVIRTQSAIEIKRNMQMSAWEIMQEAPFQLALENVTVIVDEH